MLVRPLSMTNEVIGDEHVPRVRFNMLGTQRLLNEALDEECQDRKLQKCRG